MECLDKTNNEIISNSSKADEKSDVLEKLTCGSNSGSSEMAENADRNLYVDTEDLLGVIKQLPGDFGQKVRASLEVLKDTLRLAGPRRTIASFNGGKDAVVILHLLRAAITDLNLTDPTNAIFFQKTNEFEDIINFTLRTAQVCDVELNRLTDSYKDGIKAIVDSLQPQSESRINCLENDPVPIFFVMGTRVRDPDARGFNSLAAHRASDGWIPTRFIRVQPIATWSYADVWRFIHSCNIPYCSLYDEGYTSIGNVTDTKPNPALLQTDGTYLPAHALMDGTKERLGRNDKVPPPPPANRIKIGLIIYGEEILTGRITDYISGPTIDTIKKSEKFELKRVLITHDDIKEDITFLRSQVDIVLILSTSEFSMDQFLFQTVAEITNQQLTNVSIETWSYGKVSLEIPSSGKVIKNDRDNHLFVKVDNIVMFCGDQHGMKSKLNTLERFMNNEKMKLLPSDDASVVVISMDEC